jgi:hypothetical protein
MGATTQLTTFDDLKTDLMNRTREQTGVSATETQAGRYVNIALQDMHVGFAERFPWAERRSQIVTNPRHTTGTVTATIGSTSLVGSSTDWTTAGDYGVANTTALGKMVINSTNDVYQFVPATTVVGLITPAYISATAAGADYVWYQDEYDLASDFLRPIDQQKFSSGGSPIDLIGRTEFRRRYPKNSIPGTPHIASLLDITFGSDTSPVRRIQLHPPPDSRMVIPYSYVTSNLAVTAAGAEQSALSSDDDEPIVPLRYRHAILFHALYHWYRDKKDDARTDKAKTEYTSIMLRIYGDSEIGERRPQIRPRVGTYRRAAKRPWGGKGSRYDLDGRFDRLER